MSASDVQPRLPFAPLQQIVEGRTIKSAWNPFGCAPDQGALTRLGWLRNSWQRRAYEIGKRDGGLTVRAADKLACDLGMHPSEIWGDEWWSTAKECA